MSSWPPVVQEIEGALVLPDGTVGVYGIAP
jgi:hypothetical protein